MSLWRGQQGPPIAFASLVGLLAAAAAARALTRSSKATLLEAPEPTEKEPYPWNLYEGGAYVQRGCLEDL
jgi:hypothetical protein